MMVKSLSHFIGLARAGELCRSFARKSIVFPLILLSFSVYSQRFSNIRFDSCTVNGFSLEDSIGAMKSVFGETFIYSQFDLSDAEQGFRMQHTFKYDSILFLFIETKKLKYIDAVVINGQQYGVHLNMGVYRVGDSTAKLAENFPSSWNSFLAMGEKGSDKSELYIVLYMPFKNRQISRGTVRFLISEGKISEILIRQQF